MKRFQPTGIDAERAEEEMDLPPSLLVPREPSRPPSSSESTPSPICAWLISASVSASSASRAAATSAAARMTARTSSVSPMSMFLSVSPRDSLDAGVPPTRSPPSPSPALLDATGESGSGASGPSLASPLSASALGPGSGSLAMPRSASRSAISPPIARSCPGCSPLDPPALPAGAARPCTSSALRFCSRSSLASFWNHGSFCTRSANLSKKPSLGARTERAQRCIRIAAARCRT
mmetsp:Transcript_75041/g.225581  ORF Transcript_75041/g.225581 Transcript_75041/m.225581 type:complete len:235 (-) Transcript_75041:768-1472(-)